KRYHVVVVGKCAGLYYDVWENVQELVDFVPGAMHKGFSNQQDAERHYRLAQHRNWVKIIRNPGDDQIYGPEADTM
ncbi:hypothetical protein K443DRAFT_33266, partial [Laccaria amethystina LaAM-08-1]